MTLADLEPSLDVALSALHDVQRDLRTLVTEKATEMHMRDRMALAYTEQLEGRIALLESELEEARAQLITTQSTLHAQRVKADEGVREAGDAERKMERAAKALSLLGDAAQALIEFELEKPRVGDNMPRAWTGLQVALDAADTVRHGTIVPRMPGLEPPATPAVDPAPPTKCAGMWGDGMPCEMDAGHGDGCGPESPF